MTSHRSLARAQGAFQRSLGPFFCRLICATIVVQPLSCLAQRLPANRPRARTVTVTVKVSPGHPVNRFIPSQALGAGVDGHAEGETLPQLSVAHVASMLSAGFKPL